MRTEVKLDTIRQETRSGFADVREDTRHGLEVLELVRREVSALRITGAATSSAHYPYRSSRRSSDEFKHNVIAFAESTPLTSAPMLRTPNVITEELLTTAYIKLQLSSILTALERLSMPTAFTPDDVEKFWFSRPVESASMNIARIRHQAVRYVLAVRDLFEERTDTVSMYRGAGALNTLSIWLGELNMHHERNLIGDWTVTLARTLVDGSNNGHPDCVSILALYLLNQSNQFHDRDDMIRGLQTIEEAHAITQKLRDQHSGEVQFQILHGEVLSQYANFVEVERSIQISVEAVQVLEEILNVRAFSLSKSIEGIQMAVKPISSLVDRLFSSAPLTTTIMAYTHALQRLGSCSIQNRHRGSSPDLELLVVAIYRKMVLIHGPQYRAYLAWALFVVVHHQILLSFPTGELVDQADECLQLLRELAQANPLRYAREIVYVLWDKAIILVWLQRHSEAITTYEESASIAGQILQDSKLHAQSLGRLREQFRRLDRFDDAVRSGALAITIYHDEAEAQAEGYLTLCEDLRQLRRYKECAEAAQKSVVLYRHLAINNSGTWMNNLTQALAILAHCLAASGDYPEALIAWKESARMVDDFLNAAANTNSADIDNLYHGVVCEHISISHLLADGVECLAVCSTAVRHIRRLSELHSQNAEATQYSLWNAEFCYAYNMHRLGRLQDATQYIDCCLDAWTRKPDTISEVEITRQKATMIALKVDVLDAQGYTEQASLLTQKVSGDPSMPFHRMIESMVQEAHLQMNLERGEGAIQMAEEALRLCLRELNLDAIVDSMLRSSHGVAFTALICQNFDRAIEAAREGCNIPIGPAWMENETEYNSSIRPSLFAILASAEANLGRYDTALEYARHAVDVSRDMKARKWDISATAAEQSAMETRGYLADILLATGDIAQARQICEERRTYFAERVENKMGDYRELAPILRMLGVLRCSEGRHEEGEAAAQELCRIMKMLGSAFRGLQEQVKIRLRRQAQVPILKVLDDMRQKLDCIHQTEVATLFEI